MYRQFRQEEPDEEVLSLIPEFDETVLSSSSQKRIRRSVDQSTTDTIIRANRVMNHHKMAMVSILCQGHVEDAVTAMISRNPNKYAAAHLIRLAEANADYLYDNLCDDYDGFWRW